MTDCPNVEVRELLPEYLHSTLSESDRARVNAHLATCAECSRELALLQSARVVMASVRLPRIDTAAVVAALPRPRAAALARTVSHRSPTLFRLAAAVTFISLGGISVAVARSFFGDAVVVGPDSVIVTPDVSPRVAPPLASADTPRAGTAARGLAVHPSISALGDDDLESLLSELDQLEAVPLAEPETTPGGRAVAGAIIGS